MIHVGEEQLEQTLSWDKLIPRIMSAFSKKQEVPQRHHHQYPNPKEQIDSTLLLMPAWDDENYLGIKIVNVSPNNGKHGLPAVQGSYILFDLHTGVPLASMEATKLTTKRTAATSALVSSLVSRKDSSVLFMVGTGTLAPELISAHSFVRPITEVIIWGRDSNKAQDLAMKTRLKGVKVRVVKNVQEGMSKADIVSCATLSTTPLILGKWVKEGQHIDLVGSYRPDMREADDLLIEKSSIYVDTIEAAIKETGDIFIPLNTGILKQSDIKADLFGLCSKPQEFRKSSNEITCFKSVGHAIEDLAAGSLVYESL